LAKSEPRYYLMLVTARYWISRSKNKAPTMDPKKVKGNNNQWGGKFFRPLLDQTQIKEDGNE